MEVLMQYLNSIIFVGFSIVVLTIFVWVDSMRRKDQSRMEEAKNRAAEMPDQLITVELNDNEIFTVVYDSRLEQWECSRTVINKWRG